MMEPVQKFCKLRSSHVGPAIFRVKVNLKSFWHRRTDKRKWQLSVKGGVGKLVGGTGRLVGGIGKLVGVIRKPAEGFNFLLNVVPSLTGTFGDFLQFAIDSSFRSGVGRLRKPGLFTVYYDVVSWLSA
jgi:X-X-X-Leu-X-X-Gly heptad repeat protein